MTQTAQLFALGTRELLDLDNPLYEAVRAEQGEGIRQIASDIRELFMDSEQGTRVLTHLMNMTINKPVSNVESTERGDMWAGGRADLVWYIIKMCQTSEGETNG